MNRNPVMDQSWSLLYEGDNAPQGGSKVSDQVQAPAKPSFSGVILFSFSQP
jgi:hypothetical protein